MPSARVTRPLAAIAMTVVMTLAGCLGGVGTGDDAIQWDVDYYYIDPPYTYEDARNFTVADPLNNETWGNSSWTVYGNTHGGNCCEHYLAATKEGWILNFGGEYPTWSTDRGHTWQEYVPGVTPTWPECRNVKMTLPGTEGLGEGSIVQTTTGDIIAMGWFPYPSVTGADQFYAFLYDQDDAEWKWCYARPPEAFYDRSWQVEVVGPVNTIYGSGEYASLVISNFWHQVANRGGQISVDGLNYYNFDFPDRDEELAEIEVDLDFEQLGMEWDFTKPHKEMRAFPVPSGGLYFPSYFDDGSDAYLDTSLNWWTATTANGSSLPSEYCALDSSTALHCVIAGGTVVQHMLSWDGGETWQNRTYNLSGAASELEEWEFHANGVHDLFVLNVRYQSAEGPDVDVAFHVREFSQSLEPDVLTYLGLGDLDSTSGAGNEIRFDFASMGILPDGGAFIAYHDSTDPDPLFGVELLIPKSYGPVAQLYMVGHSH